MFSQIASAAERIFSAFTQHSRRPVAAASALCLVLVVTLAVPAMAVTPQDVRAIRTQRALMARGQIYPAVVSAPVEKDAAMPSGADHLDFGFVKAGETSSEKEATFTFNRTVTLGKIDVLTMGAPNLDFTDAGTGTCEVNRTYSAGASCAVRVNVTPRYAGERKGAVVLSDTIGERVGTLFVAAVSSMPELLFISSETTTDLSVDGVNVSGVFWNDPEGAAIDGSGNIYVTDTETNSLYKLAAGTYARTTIDTDNGAGSLDGPWGVAVDGSGNVYVAASGLTDSTLPNVYKYAAGTFAKSVVGSGWVSPNEVAVDGSGNVYVADFGGGLLKVSGSTVTQIGKANTTGSGANDFAVAVDSSGNVYASVWVNPQIQGTVFKETWNGGNSYTESVISANFVTPTGIAVQPSGNLYVTDDNDGNAPGGGVYQETFNGSSWTQSTFSTSVSYPESVVLDVSGNLYIARFDPSSSGNGIYEESFTSPPSFNFGSVNVGSTSTSQALTIENTGNAALTFYSLSSSENPTLPAGYIFGTGNTCPEVAANGSNGSLAIGASCVLSIAFKPTNNGADTGSAVLTDNNDNLVDTTQSISVSGTGTGGVAPLITSANGTSFTLGSAGDFTVTTTGTPKPALTESGALPGGVSFTDNGNGTATLAGTPTAVGTFTITITAASGVTPNATQSFTLTVSGTAPTITSASSTTFTVGSAGSFTATASGTPIPTFSETGTLPSGVTFTSGGNLSGTPAAGTGGTYSITITASNGVSPNATQSFMLTVDQAPAITSPSSTTFTVGSAGTFTATASGYPAPTFSETGALPSGVTFTSVGVLSGTPAAGAGGTYSITITASNGVSPNATQSFTLTVGQAPAITSASNTTFTVGSAGSFTATASGYPVATFSETGALPTGVTFTSGGLLSGTPTGAPGTYPFTISASNGVGSPATQSFILTVDKASTATVVTSTANPSVFGQAVTFTATVSAVSPSTGTPTGTVTFLDGGSPIGTGTLNGGVAIFTTSALATGSHTLTTSYGGDGNFNGSTGSLISNPEVVNKAGTSSGVSSAVNPSVFGQSVTFTATVSAVTPGAGTPTGTVTFLDGSSPIGTGTLSSSVATFTTSVLAGGSHTITTSYGGDGNFNGSTGSLAGNPQVVGKAATTTAINSITPPGPITVGSSVSVAASVTTSTPGAGTPSGTITVSDGGSGVGDSCAITLPGASCSLTPSSTGSQSIIAAYSGDSNFLGSTSSATSLSVTPPSRTVTASAGPNGSITPATQYIVDGNTASFVVTPDNGYTAMVGGTCPSGALSNNTYTTGAITGDCAVMATFASASTSMTLLVTDNDAYARYGNLVNYVVTASNATGADITGLSISAGTSPDLDTAAAHWLCFGSAMQCAPTGSGPFADNTVTVPAQGSVTWLVTVPVLQDAPDATASYTVTLDGPSFASPITQTDTDTLVVFRDGFDMPFADGTQYVAPVAAAKIITSWEGNSSLTFGLPTMAGAMIEPVLSASSADNSGFRVERLNGATQTWLRAVAFDPRGREQPTGWTKIAPHPFLTIGIAGTPAQRMLILIGAENEIDVPLTEASSWRVLVPLNSQVAPLSR